MKYVHASLPCLPAGIALMLALVAIIVSGCDTAVNDTAMPEQPFDATGTLSGRVIDRVTSASISGATIRIAERHAVHRIGAYRR